MNSNNADGSGSGSLIQKWIDLSCGLSCLRCDLNTGDHLGKCSVLKARTTEKHIEEQMRVMYPKIFAEMRGEE